MTAIAGFVANGAVWIGGDSAGVSRLDLTLRADQKVFVKGEFAFGFTTSFRMGQLIRYSFTPPALVEKQNVFAYMVTGFVDSLRNVLKTGGYAEKENEAERGGTFLVGFRGRLFTVESDYQVGESLCGYSAIGCGDQAACGALYAMQGIYNISPHQRLTTALEAAEHHSAGVRRPFEIVNVATPVEPL